MRKFIQRIASLALLAILILIPQTARAESGYIKNASLDSWSSGLPEDFGFYIYNCTIKQDEGAVMFGLEEQGYGYLFQQVELKPDTTYVITGHVRAENVTGRLPGVHISIESQLAESGGIFDTAEEWQDIKLYVRTNGDENQKYIIDIGIGNANSICTGKVWIDSVNAEEVDTLPVGAKAYTLIGSLSQGEKFSPVKITMSSAANKNRVEHDKDEVSYDHLGTAFFAAVFAFTIYAAITGKWASKLGRFLSGKWVLPCLFAAGFLLRVSIAWSDTGHVTDMPALKQWAVSVFENGIGRFYANSGMYGYSPAYTYIVYFAGMFRSIFGLPYDSNIFGLALRLPAILADVGVAYLIYKAAKKRLNKGTAVLTAMALLVAPVLIIGSSAWGKLDSIFVLACVGALYLLSENKKIAASALWVVAFMLKIQALMVAPVFLYVFVMDLLKKEERQKTAIQAILSLLCIGGVYTLIALPLRGEQPLNYWLSQSAGIFGGAASNNAFNFMGMLFGNTATAKDKLLLLDWGTIGLLAVGIFSVLGAFLYIKRVDKKQCFFLAALVSLGIFTFGFGMSDGDLLLAVVCMHLAAIMADSRRLLLAATVFSIVCFFNIYTVYAYGAVAVPDGLIILLSAFELGSFFYFLYVIADILQGKKLGDAIAVPPEEVTSFAERSRLAAGRRLEEENDRRIGMKKIDYVLVILITAVYAVTAFLNLGSMVIPAEGKIMTENNTAVIELENAQYVGQFKYYAGYCEGRFRLYYSADGVGYTEISNGIINHNYSAMFRWEIVDINAEIKYVKIVVTSGEMEFREIGLFNADNHRLEGLTSAYLSEDSVKEDASFLTDEQDQVPEETSFLTEMYFDEVYHARTAYEYIHGIYPYEITHPPLGKSIITIGIKLFGFNPFGWRCMGTLFGVMMLPVMYIFAKKLFKKSIYAATATILFATDFMHFSLTRIATIDSYSIFFIMMMYFFMYLYKEHNFHKEKLWRTFVPLGLCGIFFALGAATKWICIYAGAGIAILFFQTIYCRQKEYRYALENGMEEIAKNYRKKLMGTFLFCVLMFIFIPVVVYCLSYIPYQNASPNGFGLKGILENQKFMLTYHGLLKTETLHPYQSNVFTWPFTIRPVFFYRADGVAADSAGVLWCMGSPLVWIGGLALIIYLIAMRKQGKADFKGLPFVSIAALIGYLPWMLVSREIFIYHFFAVVPFMILASVFALRYIVDNFVWGKKFLYTYVTVAVLLFIAFYPANTGMVVSRVWLNMIRWFPTWPL